MKRMKSLLRCSWGNVFVITGSAWPFRSVKDVGELFLTFINYIGLVEFLLYSCRTPTKCAVMQTDPTLLDRVENPEFAGELCLAMTFQQAFQQAVLLSCPDALPGAAAVAAPIALPDERQFSFTTRYRKSHATLAWTIDDYAIRDANEEKLQVEFSAGDAADETRWKLQCFFGSCHDDHKGESKKRHWVQ